MTPEQILNEIFAAKKKRNPRYSLRSFSRELGINVATLSRALSGKQNLSLYMIRKLARHRSFDGESRAKLSRAVLGRIEEASESSPAATSVFGRRAPRFDFDWIDLAILDYFSISAAPQSTTAIAQAFGVKPARVFEAIEKLEISGLVTLDEKEDRYKKRDRWLFMDSADADLPAIRAYHKGLIERGVQELARTSEEAMNERLINSYLVATSPEKIVEAKERIERFEKELVAFLGDCEATQIYSFCGLFFPLSR